VPELPSGDANVTASCPACHSPMPTGRARTWCSARCRQAAYRARYRASTPVRPPLPIPVSRAGFDGEHQATED